ncbi:MAG: glycosyltransferase family 1 protein [Nitrospinae bacterium]|nr:glycosyltransferase family 1 protein [Nitrospinota bacterium]
MSDSNAHVLLATNFKEHHLGWYVYRALKSLGHRVTVASPLDGPAEELVKVPEDVNMPEFVRGMTDKPDIFLFVETSAGNRFFPRGLLELDIPTAGWLGDNYLNFRWHKEYCAMFDYAFFCQLGRMRLAQKIYRYEHLHWLPFAADEEYHRDFNLERDIDVGYVGSVIPEKRKFFDKMEKAGVPVRFNEVFLKREDVGRYNSRCKIVYNICARFDVNLRTFEACLAGALLVGQRVIDEGFFEIFTPGVDCDVHDFDDAPEIIKKYLADPERLRRVALAGQNLVAEKHTYRRRMEELLRACSAGVTQRRLDFAKSYLADLKMALVYGHPSFKMKREAGEHFQRAFKMNFFGSILYLARYAYWRVTEKIEKTIWEAGKRPV